nr:AsmA-like C-terminal region-containing protein [Breoghania sp. L-A4]
MKAADADLDITTKGITWDKLTIGASRLTVGLKGGVLNADLKELALYGGTATGRVLLDGQAEVPRVAAVASLGGLSAHPLLRDAAGFDWIEGTAAIDLDVAASGRSQAELVGALSGSARTSFTDGAIRGINIPQMMRGLSVQTLLGWQSATAEKTDFSELSGSFAIDKGVARNTDLKMVGPLVRISGSGTTDMPRKYLDWRVEPKVVASLKGQGAGDAELAGLGVPVIIRGPWDKPKIYPDIAGILENPDAAYKQLREIGGGLLSALKDDPGKAASEALKQVTNGGAIDVQKVIDGEADTDAVLKALEDGFNLPSGIFGFGKKK